MKLSNKFQVFWWVVLLLLFSTMLLMRIPAFKNGKIVGTDYFIFITWLALLLAPIFKEINILGLIFKQRQQPLGNTVGASIMTATETASSLRLKEVLKRFDSPLLVKQEKILKEQIEKMNFTSPEDKDDLLVRALATAQIGVTFEKIYFSIFGSQIEALQYLNESKINLVETENIKKFYNSAKSKHQEYYAIYTFERWLDFLASWFLIVRQEGKIGISVRGQEFLKYIVEQRYSSKKAG